MAEGVSICGGMSPLLWKRRGRGLVGGEFLSDERNIRCQISLEGESVWMI